MLRVRGTSTDVQRVWECDERWAGLVEIPVDEAIERERELAKENASK
jgi:hypothetical protein